MKDFTIQKKSIFIVSGGRTATRFLSELLAISVKSCHSIQEPDVWRIVDLVKLKKNRKFFLQKIKDYGAFNMTFGKVLPLGSARNLSIARQLGKIDKIKAAKKFYQTRRRPVSRTNKTIYAEANLQLVGLLDIIPLVFPNSKTVFIIRDGRNWVRSYMNIKNPIYSKHDPLYYIPYSRLKAKMIQSDPFSSAWNHFSVFQRICWFWRFHIGYALKTIKKNPNARTVHYEHLFDSSMQEKNLNGLLRYLTTFPDKHQAEYQYKGELTGKWFHESHTKQFPKWEEWSLEMVKEFHEICGDLLLKQGYGSEPQWQEMIS